MIVYRIQVSEGKDWLITWVAESASARRLAKQIAKAKTDAVIYLDKVEVISGRKGICEALNTATMNRTTPGACAFEPVTRTEPKTGDMT